MQTISFRNTVLFKRGMWASAAAVLAFVALPPLASGAFAAHPAVNGGVCALVAAFVVYFLGRIRIHRLADEVQDCGDALRVRKGRIEEMVALAGVESVYAASGGGFHRITIRLRAPARLGREFDFLPPASLWGNPGAVRRAASELADRAARAAARAG